MEPTRLRHLAAGLGAVLLGSALALALTATPALAGTALSVSPKTSWWSEDLGNGTTVTHLIGEVSNAANATASARDVRISCSIFKAPSTAPLASETTSAAVDILKPGDRSAFDDLFFSAPDFDRAVCAVAGPATTNLVADHDLTPLIASVSTDPDTLIQTIQGTVQNLRDVAVSNARVYFTFYDGSGTPIDQDFADVNDGGPVPPGLANAGVFELQRFPSEPPWTWNGFNGPSANDALLAEAPAPWVYLPDALAFGNQVEGTSATRTVTLSNIGTGDLVIPAGAVAISGINATDFQLVQDGCSHSTLPSEGTCSLGIKVTPSAYGSRVATLAISDNASLAQQSLSLSAFGLSRAAVSAPAVSFGNVPRLTSVTKILTIISSGLDPATLTGVSLTSGSDKGFGLDPAGCPTGVAMAAGQTCSVTVSFLPGSTGAVTGTVTVSATDANGDPARQSPLSVSLTGTGTQASPSISFNKTSPFDLGEQTVGVQSPTFSVTLTNGGTAPLHLDSSSIGASPNPEYGAQSADCPATLAIGSSCHINVTVTPAGTGSRPGQLTVSDSSGSPSGSLTLTATGVQPTTFYFAEGFTSGSFQENLALFMPGMTGTARIDYTFNGGGGTSKNVNLAAGKVLIENVNSDLNGAIKDVSAKVTLPGPGVVERVMRFNTGTWHGSTDLVGVNQPNSEWDFAEGSTLPSFSEYLTLQNPNASAVTVTMNHFTDKGAHLVRSLSLAPLSRTTIEVFRGNTSTATVTGCTPSGLSGNCGVGPNVGGVSTQVTATQPIIAERPFYLNGKSFGFGTIRDGHDAFGANAANTQWNFAEGSTASGFTEYLTLQNPGTAPAAVTLAYVTDQQKSATKLLTLPPTSRTTIEVFHGNLSSTPAGSSCVPNGLAGTCGVGPNIAGVAVQVTSNKPIVAERPMYSVRNFGTGTVAGATDVVGSNGFSQLFGFAAASTASGENDFLTIQNVQSTDANVTVKYFTSSGTVTVGPLTVKAKSRRTVQVFSSTEGVGTGKTPVGIVVTSTQPVLVEKSTYGSTSGSYGATDTIGYATGSF